MRSSWEEKFGVGKPSVTLVVPLPLALRLALNELLPT
jgi:hypothetical protein